MRKILAKLNQKPSKKTIMIVALLVIGFTAGFITSRETTKDRAGTSDSTTVTLPSEFRTNFVALGVEHVSLMNRAVSAELDGSEGAGEFKTALYENAKSISVATNGFSPDSDAEQKINDIWKAYLDQVFNYAQASAKGDENAKNEAKQAITTGYVEGLSKYLAEINPNIVEISLRSGLDEQADVTLKMIDFHVKDDHAKEATNVQEANMTIKAVFSMLAEAVVKNSPDKF